MYYLSVLLVLCCLAAAQQQQYELKLRVANGGFSPFVKPCVVPDMGGMVILPTQSGLFVAYVPGAGALSHPVLNLTDKISVLTRTSHTGGLACGVHVDTYTDKASLFATYTAKPPVNSTFNNILTLSRFDLNDTLFAVADRNSEEVWFTLGMETDQRPGGGIAISDGQGGGHAHPRDFLFLGTGVGWQPGETDPAKLNRSLSWDNDYGAIHRFGIGSSSNGLPYSIPESNPVAGSTLFAKGYANPLYLAVDGVNGQLTVGDIQTIDDLYNGHWQTLRVVTLGSTTLYPDVVGPGICVNPNGCTFPDNYIPPLIAYNEGGSIESDGTTYDTTSPVRGTAFEWFGKDHTSDTGFGMDSGIGYVNFTAQSVLTGIKCFDVQFPDPETNPLGYGTISLENVTNIRTGPIASIATSSFPAPNGNQFINTYSFAFRPPRAQIWERVPVSA